MNKEEIKEPAFKNYKEKQRYYETLSRRGTFIHQSIKIDDRTRIAHGVTYIKPKEDE